MYKIIGFFVGILFFSNNVQGQDSLIQILDEELSREFAILSKEKVPAYYLAYNVDESQNTVISSSLGSLTSSNEYKNRILTASVRVGDYNFDNTHIFEGHYEGRPVRSYNFSVIPLDNDAYAIKSYAWKLTDRTYKNAVNTYKILIEKKKSLDVSDNHTPDFSKESAHKYMGKKTDKHLVCNKTEWENKIKSYTLPFVDDKEILSAEAYFSFNVNTKYFISSEGTKIIQTFSYAQLHINAEIKSDDDDLIPFSKSFYAYTPDRLPSNDSIIKEIYSLKHKLQQLKKAPVAEPYTGPAILSAKSAGVFFHEIFGHRIEANRLKYSSDGQTFKEKINDKILHKNLSVIFDPSRISYNGTDLFGHYHYDDQGVKGQKVTVVENGILKEFLMSRMPIKGFDKSNGHGRAQYGYDPIARQSNMFIESKSSYSDKELRKKLLKECKKQKKEYGYFFKEVIGGFTTTDRYVPNVFNIIPIEVYKIYLDGRPDELVRGVDLIGTPLTVFSKILATGNHKDVFNGFCGAESGSIPVSTIAPALFVEQIETQLKPVSKVELPILPRPGINNKYEN